MKVIIVHRDTAVLESLEILLGCWGYQVKWFDDPFAAFSFLEREPDFDALIFDYDYSSPGIDSYEVLRRVRPVLPKECKVVLVSWQSDLIEAFDTEAEGVTAFLAEPMDLNAIRRAIGEPRGVYRHHALSNST